MVEVDFEAEPLARVPDQRSAVTYQEKLGAFDMRCARPRVLPSPFRGLDQCDAGASSFGVAKRSTIETEESVSPSITWSGSDESGPQSRCRSESSRARTTWASNRRSRRWSRLRSGQ